MALISSFKEYVPFKRGLNRKEAALYIGVSPTLFDELVKDRSMPQPKRLRTRVLWDVRDLDEAFDQITGSDGNPWDVALGMRAAS